MGLHHWRTTSRRTHRCEQNVLATIRDSASANACCHPQLSYGTEKEHRFFPHSVSETWEDYAVQFTMRSPTALAPKYGHGPEIETAHSARCPCFMVGRDWGLAGRFRLHAGIPE